MSTGPNLTVGDDPVHRDATRNMTVRVYSPDAGIQVRLKVEDAADHDALGRDRGDDHGGQRLGDADVRLRQPGHRHGRAEPGLHLQQDLDLLQLRRDRRQRRRQDVLLRRREWSAAAAAIVFASGYASNNRTVEGGEWGFYSGNFTNYSNTYAGGGFVDGARRGAGGGFLSSSTSSATSAPTTDGYMGIYTMAPGYTVAAPNAGVTLNGQANLKIELGMAAEWFQQASNKALTVRTDRQPGVLRTARAGSARSWWTSSVTPTTADLTSVYGGA